MSQSFQLPAKLKENSHENHELDCSLHILLSLYMRFILRFLLATPIHQNTMLRLGIRTHDRIPERDNKHTIASRASAFDRPIRLFPVASTQAVWINSVSWSCQWSAFAIAKELCARVSMVRCIATMTSMSNAKVHPCHLIDLGM
jgi:hypothetical protein